MLLRTDDDVTRLRAVWLGPDQHRLPVDWTYIEWAAAGGVFAATVVPSLIVWVKLLGVLGLVVGLFASFAAGGIARQVVAALVDSDRPFRYRAGLARRAAVRFVWAHGPVDRAVVGPAVGVGVVLFPVAGFLPAAAVAAVVAVAARWIRDRVESPARYWARVDARAARAPGGRAVAATRSIPMEIHP